LLETPTHRLTFDTPSFEPFYQNTIFSRKHHNYGFDNYAIGAVRHTPRIKIMRPVRKNFTYLAKLALHVLRRIAV